MVQRGASAASLAGFLPRPFGERAGVRGADGSVVELYPLSIYVRAVSGYVRQSVAFICTLPSRERVKGARRRPLNHPGSRHAKSTPSGQTFRSVIWLRVGPDGASLHRHDLTPVTRPIHGPRPFGANALRCSKTLPAFLSRRPAPAICRPGRRF